jgi:hypothetical protein
LQTAAETISRAHSLFEKTDFLEHAIAVGEAKALYGELNADIAAGELVIQPETATMEQ